MNIRKPLSLMLAIAMLLPCIGAAEEGWSGYFPERSPVSTTCMMDAPSWLSRYDQLLRTFIYDRIMAKVARK